MSVLYPPPTTDEWELHPVQRAHPRPTRYAAPTELDVALDLVAELGDRARPIHDEVVAASMLVPDDVVQRICAAGGPDDVRSKVAEYVANGCTCPILYPLGPDVRYMIDTFAGR